MPQKDLSKTIEDEILTIQDLEMIRETVGISLKLPLQEG
jgi:hypothetical protein